MSAVRDARDRLRALLPDAEGIGACPETCRVMPMLTIRQADALADRLTKGDEAIAAVQDLARLIESLHDDCLHLATRAGVDPMLNRHAISVLEPVLATLAGHVRRLAGPDDGAA